jgi:predicted DNA binding CopG/RHH family protein
MDDLTEYGLSGARVVRFELCLNDKTVDLRLPCALLNAVRREAVKAGMPHGAGTGCRERETLTWAMARPIRPR